MFKLFNVVGIPKLKTKTSALYKKHNKNNT